MTPLVITSVVAVALVALFGGLLAWRNRIQLRRIRIGLRRSFRRSPVWTALAVFVPLFALFGLLAATVSLAVEGQGSQALAFALVGPMSLFCVAAGAGYCWLGNLLQRALRRSSYPIRFVLQLGVLIYALGLIPALIAFFLAAGVLADLLGVL